MFETLKKLIPFALGSAASLSANDANLLLGRDIHSNFEVLSGRANVDEVFGWLRKPSDSVSLERAKQSQLEAIQNSVSRLRAGQGFALEVRAWSRPVGRYTEYYLAPILHPAGSSLVESIANSIQSPSINPTAPLNQGWSTAPDEDASVLYFIRHTDEPITSNFLANLKSVMAPRVTYAAARERLQQLNEERLAKEIEAQNLQIANQRLLSAGLALYLHEIAPPLNNIKPGENNPLSRKYFGKFPNESGETAEDYVRSLRRKGLYPPIGFPRPTAFRQQMYLSDRGIVVRRDGSGSSILDSGPPLSPMMFKDPPAIPAEPRPESTPASSQVEKPSLPGRELPVSPILPGDPVKSKAPPAPKPPSAIPPVNLPPALPTPEPSRLPLLRP